MLRRHCLVVVVVSTVVVVLVWVRGGGRSGRSRGVRCLQGGLLGRLLGGRRVARPFVGTVILSLMGAYVMAERIFRAGERAHKRCKCRCGCGLR